VDGGKTALDMLEKMIQATMIRGAQSGGIVTYYIRNNQNRYSRKAIRSRVVKSKRSDLSKLIRQKIHRDACNLITHHVPQIGSSKQQDSNNTNVRFFSGHTRFATSASDSFIEGTHPQIWTPRAVRRFFWHPEASGQDSSNVSSRPSIPFVGTVKVENCITHNGDLDFYMIQGTWYGLANIQKWLEHALECKMRTTVDSAAIAGLVDLIRTQGCFALSARYAVCFALPTSVIDPNPVRPLPTYQEYEKICQTFERELENMLQEEKGSITLDYISSNPEERDKFADKVTAILQLVYSKASDDNMVYNTLSKFIDEEEGASLGAFVRETINAYFDNDLLHTTRLFMENAKGSFGLVVTSSLDAHRQVCIAARGQPMSIAFYPKKGLVCYGSSEQSVKAGMGVETPGGDKVLNQVDSLSSHFLPLTEIKEKQLGISFRYHVEHNRCQLALFAPNSISEAYLPHSLIGTYIISVDGKDVKTEEDVKLIVDDAVKVAKNKGLSGINLLVSRLDKGDHKTDEVYRLDLEDVGGEVCLLDWGYAGSMIPIISPPNRNIVVHKLMGNAINVVVLAETKVLAAHDGNLFKRMTLLEGNPLVTTLPSQFQDPVLRDIQDIPRVCQAIQEDWQKPNLNRQTAWYLGHCIRERMTDIANGSISRNAGSVDIILTGCEVSLWIAENFASDLQKAFPKLFVKAVSSNKIVSTLNCVFYD
jgi:hypothetical protein